MIRLDHRFRFFRLLCVLLAVLLTLPVSAQAQQGEAQGEPDQVFAQVTYMKVQQGQADEYVSVERELWKPIHEELANDGKILGWGLYAVRFPGGTGHDYNYVTVTFYDSMADVEDLEYATYAERAHPDKDVNVVLERTFEARKAVRGELWTRLDEVTPEASPSEPPPFIRLDYMKVSPGGAEDYVNLEQNVWKPVHQARLDAGTIAGWELWQMILPGGTSQPHNYATVTGFQSMADMPGYPEGVWDEVHPDQSTDEILQQTLEARDLVQTELWELVDGVSGDASGAE